MAWHDDPRNPRLVPRCASSGISTSSPGAPPAEARDNGDDGNACYDAGSIGIRSPEGGDANVRDVHRRQCDGSGLHHLIPLFLVIGVVGLVVTRRTVDGQRATLCALSQRVLRSVLLRMDQLLI